MELIKRVSIGTVIGAVLGLALGVLLAFVLAPRHWVTVPWITNVAPQATIAGGVSGFFIGIVNWTLHRKATSDKILKRLSRALPQKFPQAIWGIVDGMVLGSVGGMVVEAIVNVLRLLRTSNGMHFLASDFSPVLFISPVVGAIAGVIYERVRKPTRRATNKVRGISSGIIFGASAGILWIASSSWWFTNSLDIVTYSYVTLGVTLGAVIFGIFVGLIAEMVLGQRAR